MATVNVVDHPDGSKVWCLNGQYHREDGPAVEHADGTKWWYIKGKCHREDGPAAEWANGAKEWYLNGEKLSEEDFRVEVERRKNLPKKKRSRKPTTPTPEVSTKTIKLDDLTVEIIIKISKT